MGIGHIHAPEPEFQYEQELTNAIASAIQSAVDGTRTVVLPTFGFGLDVVVLPRRQTARPARVFLR
jgi:hypothetical protein